MKVLQVRVYLKVKHEQSNIKMHAYTQRNNSDVFSTHHSATSTGGRIGRTLSRLGDGLEGSTRRECTTRGCENVCCHQRTPADSH